jgi:hypothetical protein
MPIGQCAACALHLDRGDATLLALEWVERKRGRVPCLVCRQTATHSYRPLAASEAVKGAYCLAHVPVEDPTEAARIVGWLTRWSHGL